MRVLFIIPKNKFSFFGHKGFSPPFPHLGVAYLIAVLQKHGHTVGLYDDGVDGYPLDVIRSFKPDLIAITIFTLSLPYAYALVDAIKERYPDIRIVAGGSHVSTIREKIFREVNVDYAVVGEGEGVIVDIANGRHIPGTIFEDELQPNLDQLPFPQFDLYSIFFHPGYGSRIIPIITSRGCPFGCNFCSVRLYMGRQFRKRSVGNVLDEIEYQHKKGYCQFDFNDDCFTLDRKRAINILDGIISSDFKIRFQFYNGLRVDTVDEEVLEKLKQAGCFYISYGCESGNDEILKGIKKGITLKQVRKAVGLTRKIGIDCSCNFIIGHKNETLQTAMDSYLFAKSLRTNFVNFYNLVPYPGTEAFDWVQANGRFLVDTENYLEVVAYNDNTPIFETDQLSRRQREEIMRKGFSLHERRVLAYRFGPILGLMLYVLTRWGGLKSLMGKVVTMSRWGNRIAIFLSRNSYRKG
jgi:anaerobic magnesium-protoporphyrin IX monomethyl ester cyclase